MAAWQIKHPISTVAVTQGAQPASRTDVGEDSRADREVADQTPRRGPSGPGRLPEEEGVPRGGGAQEEGAPPAVAGPPLHHLARHPRPLVTARTSDRGGGAAPPPRL